MEGNKAKVLAAPVTAVIGYDIDFHEELPWLFPHTDAKSWFEGNEKKIAETAGISEERAQEVIDKLLGCSLEVFQAAVYAGQEKMPDLPSMTDKQLKLMIEEAAGVEVLVYRGEEMVVQTEDEPWNMRTKLSVHETYDFRFLSKETSALATNLFS